MGEWVDGEWMGGGKSHFMDCLQQTKICEEVSRCEFRDYQKGGGPDRFRIAQMCLLSVCVNVHVVISMNKS